MNSYIRFIVIGILIVIGGFSHNQYRFIPELAYYVFGSFLILFGIYRIFSTTTEDREK